MSSSLELLLFLLVEPFQLFQELSLGLHHGGLVPPALGTEPFALRLPRQLHTVKMKPLDRTEIVIAPDHLAIGDLIAQAIRRLVRINVHIGQLGRRRTPVPIRRLFPTSASSTAARTVAGGGAASPFLLSAMKGGGTGRRDIRGNGRACRRRVLFQLFPRRRAGGGAFLSVAVVFASMMMIRCVFLLNFSPFTARAAAATATSVHFLLFDLDLCRHRCRGCCRLFVLLVVAAAKVQVLTVVVELPRLVLDDV
jgi:hypothetical protein